MGCIFSKPVRGCQLNRAEERDRRPRSEAILSSILEYYSQSNPVAENNMPTDNTAGCRTDFLDPLARPSERTGFQAAPRLPAEVPSPTKPVKNQRGEGVKDVSKDGMRDQSGQGAINPGGASMVNQPAGLKNKASQGQSGTAAMQSPRERMASAPLKPPPRLNERKLHEQYRTPGTDFQLSYKGGGPVDGTGTCQEWI